MARSQAPETPASFADRLALAIAEANSTQSRTERECGLGQGRIVRLLGKGKTPILSPGPDVIRKLADYLGVGYEWLAIGRGPMRQNDAGAPSPFEQAQELCRRARTRADAIDLVARRFRDHPAMLTAVDWILEIDAEARRLDRAGVPRPEEIAAAQRTVRRLAKKKRQLTAQSTEERADRAPEPNASKKDAR